jgi:hypothetical protein
MKNGGVPLLYVYLSFIYLFNTLEYKLYIESNGNLFIYLSFAAYYTKELTQRSIL